MNDLRSNKFIKFDGSNWVQYKYCTRSFAMMQGSLGVLDGTETRPTAGTPTAAVEGKEDEGSTAALLERQLAHDDKRFQLYAYLIQT
jgi:hypothetical protein